MQDIASFVEDISGRPELGQAAKAQAFSYLKSLFEPAATTRLALAPPEVAASRAFAHFMLWRSLSDYGDWHGDPLPPEEMAALATQADHYRQTMEE